MAVQRARIEVKRCPMSDDKCAATVIEHIALFYSPGSVDVVALVEETCGRYTRGKHVGKLRGWANLTVCTVGGWKTFGPGERNGGVIRPGTILAISITDFDGKPYIEVGRG